MATYVGINGVQTWYEEYGEGEPLVLLHPGGLGIDARALGPTVDGLAARFHVFTPERRGHGHTQDVDGPISYELMAKDTVAFLESVVGAPAHLVGNSDGTVVALITALRRPDLVRRLVVVGGVFHRDGWLPQAVEPGDSPPDFLVKLYAEVSPDGPSHARIVAAKLDRMHAEEPTLAASDLGRVKNRTLVMVGDDDEVKLEHAIAMYRGIADAELAVIPGTSHGQLVEKPALCNAIIVDFLANEPVPTLAPIRRAGGRA